MEKLIEELRKKLYSLKNMTYSFQYSYSDVGFKIFLRDFKKVFIEYEFPDNSYLDAFNAVEISKINANIEIIASKGKLNKEELKKQFNIDVDEYHELLDGMISDINIFGERYGKKFIKAKKREAAENKGSNYSKDIGFVKKKNLKK